MMHLSRPGCWILLVSWWMSFSAAAFSVSFINPGKHDEEYWQAVSDAMMAAARSLDIELRIIYLERQPYKAIEAVQAIAALDPDQRPDYVLLGNEGGTAPRALQILDAAGLNTLLVFSGISNAAERALAGWPRERFPHWLGSIEPDPESAGYQTAMALITRGRALGLQGPDGRLHLLALSGDRATPASQQRSEGMRRAVIESNGVVLEQEIFAKFNEGVAKEASQWLFKRHPEVSLVWSGNDLMAFGAMQSWRQLGGTPGSDMLFSGINASKRGMLALRDGSLSALSGGHFLLGAWALVMLYDFHHGQDFAASEGLEVKLPMFSPFTPQKAQQFLARFGGGHYDGIDFRSHSKVLNPSLTKYDFDFDPLLQEGKP